MNRFRLIVPFPPFPGFPNPEFLRIFRDLFLQWVEAGQLQEMPAQTVTPNQLLYSGAPRALSGGGVIGFVARLLGFNVGPSRLPDFEIRGGLRAPHIHLDGKIYLLNDEQWQVFSARVVEDFKARLAGAQALTLDQLASIGEARSTLGG
jgi:hypothetical protein